MKQRWTLMTMKSQPPSNDFIYQWIEKVQTDPEDKETRKRIVLHYKRLVESLARKYSKNQMIHEDLVQVGMVGLLAAVNRFDASFGNSFESYAIPTIIGEIKRFIRDKTWSVHVPRRIKELGPRIKRAIDELTNQYQQSPTIQQIAIYLEVSEEEVLETMEMGRSYHALSVDRQRDANSDGSTVSLLDILGEGESGFEEIHLKMLIDKLLTSLTDREQKILHYTYFDSLSQNETGEILGISQMHVSRLQRRALRKMRAALQGTETRIFD